MGSGNWGASRSRIDRCSGNRLQKRCAGLRTAPGDKKIPLRPGSCRNLHSQPRSDGPALRVGGNSGWHHGPWDRRSHPACTQGNGMPGSGTGTFIDPDDYQASLRQVRIDLLGTSQGAFKAHLTWVILHHLQLLHSEEDLPRIAYVSLAPALVFVGLATHPRPPIVWGGTELQTGDFIFHSRSEKFHQRTTGPCGWSL